MTKYYNFPAKSIFSQKILKTVCSCKPIFVLYRTLKTKLFSIKQLWHTCFGSLKLLQSKNGCFLPGLEMDIVPPISDSQTSHWNELKTDLLLKKFNRPGVAGAVIQTPLLLIK